MLEAYPMLQSNEIVGSAEHLIQQVKNYDYDDESGATSSTTAVAASAALTYNTPVGSNGKLIYSQNVSWYTFYNGSIVRQIS